MPLLSPTPSEQSHSSLRAVGHPGMSVCLSVCLHVSLSIFMHICLSVCLPVCVYVCMFACLSVCLTVCLSVYLSVFSFYRIFYIWYSCNSCSYFYPCLSSPTEKTIFLHQFLAATYIFCPLWTTTMFLTLLSFCLLMHGKSFCNFLTLYLLYFTFLL